MLISLVGYSIVNPIWKTTIRNNSDSRGKTDGFWQEVNIVNQTKKEYRSSVRSKRLIREEFIKLMQEKEFSKISVTDIVNEADLNRSTFYAHYPDVRGVIEEFEDQVIDNMMLVLKDFKYEHFFRILFRFC